MVHYPDTYIFDKLPKLNDVEYLRSILQPGVNLTEAGGIVGCSEPQMSIALKHHGFKKQWVLPEETDKVDAAPKQAAEVADG